MELTKEMDMEDQEYTTQDYLDDIDYEETGGWPDGFFDDLKGDD